MHPEITQEVLNNKSIDYVLDMVIESKAGLFAANLLRLYFSEAGKVIYSYSDLQKIEISNRVLSMFDFIGKIETVHELQERLIDEKLVDSRGIAVLNATKDKRQDKGQQNNLISWDSISVRQKIKIENLCAFDLDFYEKLI